MSPMKAWMQAASPEEQQALADRAETTRPYLYQLSGGFRDAGPALARRIELVTAQMTRESRGRLPTVYRTDINPDCRACEYAAKCLGPVAVRSEFDYIDNP
jgi:hypothetical protein